jgi:lipopolysaccharide transport system ATP-binding protein
MMPEYDFDVSIRVDNLGKCYRIYDSPGDRLKQALWRSRRKFYREFWALRDVTFEVRRGEALGIIGRNGSGKSTLLQIICETLTPSEGQVQTRGRVAALLELGSGFNPEFTGVENVFVNASLLGLSDSQINERLDDILAFADIGDFVHQPVKTYSSGMVVRLAFGVIANVNPDILIVDEALAVGDAVFTQKCMRFIQSVREEKSLLFVSHDPASVASLCDKCLWLDKAKVSMLDTTRKTLDSYHRACHAEFQEINLSALSVDTINPPNAIAFPDQRDAMLISQLKTDDAKIHPAIRNKAKSFTMPRRTLIKKSEQIAPELSPNEFGDGSIEIKYYKLVSAASPHDCISIINNCEIVTLEVISYCHRSTGLPSICGFNFVNDKGLILFGENTFIPDDPGAGPKGSEGKYMIANFTFTIPPLKHGNYFISIAWASGSQAKHVQHHYIHDALRLTSNSNLIRPVMGVFASDIHHISIANFDHDLQVSR